ncbi:hypothetical protein [Paracoccus sp. ME4]|uniref:hypothetical protein n=1 Tax=Paracoccus sp. ME4 TaxID=3138066 RepID=UPI00398B7678
MTPQFDFTDHFTGKSMKSAVFLCGSTVGALLFGLDIGGMAAVIDQGLSHIVPHVPFMETGTIINSYFSGIQSWVGGVALGFLDWARDVGSDAVQAAAHGMVEVRNVLGPRAGALREFFTETLRAGMDTGAAYLTSVRDSIARDPAGIASLVGETLTKAVEIFGVVKGLHEAYKYAKGRIMGDGSPSSGMPQAGPEGSGSASGGPGQNVTNIHLNIALGKDRDVGEAVEGLVRSVQRSANPEILTEHLVRTLAPHAPLTADSPVAGSDIRGSEPRPGSSDILDLLEDTAAADKSPDSAGAPLMNSDDVVWCSDSFCRGLKDGVRRNLGGKLSPSQVDRAIEGITRSRKPMETIEGGIILRATPRGELSTTRVGPRTDRGCGLLIQ